MMNKVVALTGQIASGKSEALFACGILGTRFMSMDHMSAQYFETSTEEMLFDRVKQEIAIFRKYGNGMLVFEIPIRIVNKIHDSFDDIVVVKSSTIQRLHRLQQRLGENGAMLLTYDEDFVPSHVIQNDDSKVELWQQVEAWLKDFIEIPSINWKKQISK